MLKYQNLNLNITILTMKTKFQLIVTLKNPIWTLFFFNLKNLKTEFWYEYLNFDKIGPWNLVFDAKIPN